MSIRSFIFCDFCNPDAVRTVDRRAPRPGGAGRRLDDGRAWLEAGEREAVEVYGWTRTRDGGHLCPACQGRLANGPAARRGAVFPLPRVLQPA